MRSHFRREIQFIKHRRVLFAISIVLVIASIVGVLVRGINLGIDFIGGTQVSFSGTGDVTIAQMRDAFSDAGVADAVIQTSVSGDDAGFLVRTGQTDPSVANSQAAQVAPGAGPARQLLSGHDHRPQLGADVTRSSAIAFVVVIVLIVAFVSIRYEFKMSLMAVVSLLHVMIIVMGVYAWTQSELTPNVVAALLTIMGYCLYDTVVVFNRVNENMRSLHDGVHRTALQITNFSENQVIVRSINTALCSLVPVAAMLLFGGETLKGFAFAMFIGLALGAYSSIAIAAPLYALWKGREERWRNAELSYGERAQLAAPSAQAQTQVAPVEAEPAAQGQGSATKGDSPARPASGAADPKAKKRSKYSGKVR